MAAISSAPRPHVESTSVQHPRPWFVQLLMLMGLVVGDTLAANISAVQLFRWHLHADATLQAAFEALKPGSWLAFLVVLNLSMAATFIASTLYSLKRGLSRIDESFRVMVAFTLATFTALIANALLPQFGFESVQYNQTVLITLWATIVVALVLERACLRTIISALRRHNFDTRRVLILGARAPGRQINSLMQREPGLGYRVQGFLSDSEPIGTIIDGAPVLGKPGALSRVVRVMHVDDVIIALSGRTPEEVLDIVSLAEDEAVEIQIYPDVFHLITNNGISSSEVSGLPLISIKNVALNSPINQALKRGLDLVISSIVLLLASPIMVLIAVIIKLNSRGPAFFIQQRVGLDNKPFPTLKFRTMRSDAEQLGDWTVKGDPRVTRFGRFLRRHSLDELPQFINVIRGEMSVVGPRPEQPHYVERFSQSIPRYVRRHKQKAGITGWAQVNGLRGDTSIEERTRYDLYYVENWSLLFDLKIIIKTTFDTLLGRNRGE